MWGVHDPDAFDDVVGTASARLLAAGVPRPDRVGALRLLGILSASADEHGVVRRRVADLAAEFDLPPERADGWLEALAGVGIVRHGAGVLHLAGVEPPAAGGLRLADFLATADAMEPADDHLAPVVASRRLALPRLPALAAAAALLVAVALVPMLDRDAERTLPVAADRSVSSQPAVPSTTSETTTETRRVTSTTEAGASEAPLPVVVPSTTTTAVTPSSCPIGEPLLEVLGVAEGRADGLSSVVGTIRNETGADIRLDGFTVTVTLGDQVVEVPGLDRPLGLAAGEVVRWTADVPLPAVTGAVATVTLDGWTWADDTVEQACR